MYGTIEGWIAYAALRGLVVVNEPASVQALQRASDYIRTRYVLRLAPSFDENSAETVEATYIAAEYELTTPGFWSSTFTPSQTKVLTKVEGISWTPVASSLKGSDAMLPMSPAIDSLFLGAYMFPAGPYLV